MRRLYRLVCLLHVASDVQALGTSHILTRVFLLNSGMLIELELLGVELKMGLLNCCFAVVGRDRVASDKISLVS